MITYPGGACIDVPANTDLDVQLRQHSVEYVAIAGMIGTMCVESTARSAMERGYHVTTFTDATAAIGGRDAYEAMVRRYPLISHATVTVDESSTRAARPSSRTDTAHPPRAAGPRPRSREGAEAERAAVW